jgi:hypothetical protein
VINYSVFLNTLVNSPLTQVITGQAKSIGVLALGAMFFNDVVFSPTNTVRHTQRKACFFALTRVRACVCSWA